ncbi:Protein DYAD [Apostasia shenzhenica]|uniref:Protein DYAD n=1 Tax=Apostasia shenzhenica TaxID=1088818 RepID=A0A2I0BA88_9ASPA|nr:Protein DYAD [Apostasia shenzhenica]
MIAQVASILSSLAYMCDFYRSISSGRRQIKYYYSKRNESIPVALKRPPSGRQMLSIADSPHAFPYNEPYVAGSLYEIDHQELPPKSPIQLKALRVAMVRETTLLDVTVSFPSMFSLRSFFSGQGTGCGFPELDEKFVMSSNHAGRILRRPIASTQLEAEKRLKSFWLLSPASEEEDNATKPMKSIGSCLLALKSAGVVGWGKRKKVKYIEKHSESSTTAPHDKQQHKESRCGGKRIRVETKKEKNNKKKKVDGLEGKRPRGNKDRWSTERYEAAEKRLLEIMRAKKAELRSPILRQVLREEARKHIGDTGLLDHLLKHMAGKIVADGTERFRRRHNSEGAMEYWIEPADLMEFRRKAGVTDPFWVPPQGWNLGDSVIPHSCGPDCKLAIAELKQHHSALFTMSDLSRSILIEEQQISLRKLEKEAREVKEESEEAVATWKEKWRDLLESKRKMEEEIALLSSSMHSLEGEVKVLKKKREKREVTQVVNAADSAGEGRSSDGSITEKEESDGKVRPGKKAARQSGFRICKPQGTFLWPSMAGSSTTTFAGNGDRASPTAGCTSPSSHARGVPVAVPSTTLAGEGSNSASGEQHHLMQPFAGGGPPSTSSSTASTPKLLLPAPEPTSAVVQARAHAAVVVVVPRQPLSERPAASESSFAAAYGTMAGATKASLLGVGNMNMMKDDLATVASTSWEKVGRCGGVTTELALALATPWPYR